MISKLVAAKGTSGYDILVPTGAFIPQMVENDLLLKLNKDLIPNIEHMDSASSAALGPRERVLHLQGVGHDGLRLRQDRDHARAEDVERLPRCRAERGERQDLSVLDDPAEITGMYFWANGIDWNTTDTADIDACEDYIVNTLAPHIAAFDSYPGGSAIPQGTQALMQVWNGDARLGILDCPDPDKLAVGARRADHRAVDGQLGDLIERAASRSSARVHQLRADPRERARRARLHRVPHGREGHRAGDGRERGSRDARPRLLHT